MTVKRIAAGKGHWYKIDGKKALGVTTVIKEAIPPSLSSWAARRVAEYVADNTEHVRECLDWMDREQVVNLLRGVPWQEAREAAGKGTDVHGLLVPVFAGEPVTPPESLRGWVESAVAFMDDWGVEPILSETTVASYTHGYAGTLDFVGRLPSGQVVVGDYKSGRGVYDEVALQLAAYANADVYVAPDGSERLLSELGISGGLVAHIREDDYDVWQCMTSGPPFELFLACVELVRRKEALGSFRRGPVSPAEWLSRFGHLEAVR